MTSQTFNNALAKALAVAHTQSAKASVFSDVRFKFYGPQHMLATAFGDFEWTLDPISLVGTITLSDGREFSMRVESADHWRDALATVALSEIGLYELFNTALVRHSAQLRAAEDSAATTTTQSRKRRNSEIYDAETPCDRVDVSDEEATFNSLKLAVERALDSNSLSFFEMVDESDLFAYIVRANDHSYVPHAFFSNKLAAKIDALINVLDELERQRQFAEAERAMQAEWMICQAQLQAPVSDIRDPATLAA